MQLAAGSLEIDRWKFVASNRWERTSNGESLDLSPSTLLGTLRFLSGPALSLLSKGLGRRFRLLNFAGSTIRGEGMKAVCGLRMSVLPAARGSTELANVCLLPAAR